MRLSNCVILNRVHIKNYALVADSIIGWSSKSELLCRHGAAATAVLPAAAGVKDVGAGALFVVIQHAFASDPSLPSCPCPVQSAAGRVLRTRL